jgi:DNA-binding SARP family transcriptional activator
VDAFESALRAAERAPGADALVHLQEAIAAYGGPFLPGLGDADWVLDRGAELHRTFAGALAAAGQLLVDAGRPGEAAEVYRRAVAHEPLDETAHRRLMRCLAAIGEPGRVVLIYRELSQRLRAELGVAPAAETTAIYRALTAP